MLVGSSGKDFIRILTELEDLYAGMTRQSEHGKCLFSAYRRVTEQLIQHDESTTEPEEPERSNLLAEFHQGVLEASQIKEAWDILSPQNTVGLQEKFVLAAKSGITLPSSEAKGGKAQSGRDHAFELHVAGEIAKHTGMPIGLNTIDLAGVDIYFGEDHGVECKRPRTQKNILKKIRKANKQIRGDRNVKHGHVALDTSFLLNPEDRHATVFRGDPIAKERHGDYTPFVGAIVDKVTCETANEVARWGARSRVYFASVKTYFYHRIWVNTGVFINAGATANIYMTGRRRVVPVVQVVPEGFKPHSTVRILRENQVPEGSTDLDVIEKFRL